MVVSAKKVGRGVEIPVGSTSEYQVRLQRKHVKTNKKIESVTLSEFRVDHAREIVC